MNNVLDAQDLGRPALNDADTAAEALLKRWEDAEQPSEQAAEEANQPEDNETETQVDDEDVETVEIDEDDSDSDPEEEVEPDTDDAPDVEEVELNDDLEIEVLVNGKAEQASLGQLKRLFGQEKALTQKSQEVAEQRKKAEADIGKTSAVMQKMLEKAEARFKPYQEVDFILASKTMEDADFAQLRKEAQDAADDLKFLREEADNYYGEMQQQHQMALQKQAQEAVKVLAQDIPEWNNQLYDDIRSYAVQQGLDETDVNSYVDPVVIKILNKARLYDQAKKVTTTKKKRVAKKVLKTSKAPNVEANQKAKRQKAVKAQLQNSRDLDDITNAILSRWEA